MYTKEEIAKKITDILAKDFECDPKKLTPDAKLIEDLDLDSIDAVDLIVRLQKIIKVRVNPDDFKQIRTLQDVIDAAEKVANGNH